jgi:dihydrolipoamide dehydrogenase
MIKRFFSTKIKYDLAIIGGGPGGYVAAIKAGQLGLKTACIEGRGALGGTCLNVGCIPSKTLLNISHKYHDLYNLNKIGLSAENPSFNWDSILERKKSVVTGLTGGIEFLFKKNKVDYIKGWGSFENKNTIKVSDNGNTSMLEAENIIIATGSEPSKLPGFEYDEEKIISSTGALSLKEVPKKMVVIGAGVIGLELGSVYNRMGTEVVVIEYADKIFPALDEQIAKEFLKTLKKDKIMFHFGKKCTKGTKLPNGKVLVQYQDLKTGKEESIETDVCLISTGRVPYTKNLGLEKLLIKQDKIGRVEINNNFQTNVPNIYAIGDVIEGPMLAHKAEEEGIAVVEYLKGRNVHLNYSAIPGVVYTYPEIAYVGLNEDELKARNVSYKVGLFNLNANSRHRANLDDSAGLVKILAESQTGRILGAHIMAPTAGDLIQELVLAIEYGASAEDIARTSHAHPSLSEALKEAALSAYFKAIHS